MTQPPPAHVLVDGNNALGTRPDGWWRDRPAAMRRLVAELEPLARDDPASWTVVFDGPPPADGPSTSPHLLVEHTPDRRRNAADERIVSLASIPNR